MKNFFLTGVSGLLGLNFFLYLKNKNHVYSTIHKKKIPGIKNINLNRVIRKLNHTKTFLETECERIFLNALDGSCQTPVGGYAILKKINNKDKIIFNFIAFSQDGARCVKDKIYLDIKNFKSESYKLGVKIRNKIKL